MELTNINPPRITTEPVYPYKIEVYRGSAYIEFINLILFVILTILMLIVLVVE